MQELNEIAEYYIQFNPKAASEALEKVAIGERMEFLSQLPPKVLGDFLPFLPNYLAISFLNTVEAKNCHKILEVLDSSLGSSYYSRLEKSQREQVAALLPDDQQKEMEIEFRFLPDTAGQFMDASVQAIKAGSTIEQTLHFIRIKTRITQYLYIVDEQDMLVGVTTVRRIVQETDNETLIDDIMDTSVSSILVDDERPEILDHPDWKKFSSLPVVDYGGRYLGIIHYETYAKLRADADPNANESERDAISKSLSELYGIGFSALVGSTTTILPRSQNEK